MNNLHIRKTAFILVLVGLCLSGRCRAVTTSSTQPFNNSGLAGKQIAAMGLDKFTDYYVARHPHGKSNSAADDIYRDYKELDNKRRTARLSIRRQKQLEQLCRVLQNWTKTASQLRYYSTPGTAWSYLTNLSAASFEECRGQALDDYQQPHHFVRRTNARSVRSMRGGYFLLRYCVSERAASGAMEPHDFRRTVPLFRRQTAVLARTLKTQSPAVQRVVAKYLMLCAERFNPL